MKFDCVRCQGKHPEWCGRTVCPIVARMAAYKKLQQSFKFTKEFSGETPNVFIGRKNYPNIRAGLLSTPEYKEEDEPLGWKRKNYSIGRIIELRSKLINSYQVINVKNSHKELLAEIAMSKKPVDTEMMFDKKPLLRMSFNTDLMPHGPTVKLLRARISSNPKIPRIIEKIYADTDLKATSAINTLLNKGFDEHYAVKLLSAGVIGQKTERKLVPTRWSITAVDDTRGKALIKEIKGYPPINSYELYTGSYLHNYYYVLLFPNSWSYELFETYINTVWNKGTTTNATDYESYYGRKNYAENTIGGYYAARIGVLELLRRRKRQASVLLLRFVTSDYYAPLGVWVVREAVRNSCSNTPQIFDDKKTLLKTTITMIKEKFKYDAQRILRRSKLLRNLRTQKSLREWF